ncbi:hypothetical protein BKA61DRAFT_718677 [Leptodontidium sp. MPI-SDFR-AT-0119]|nr:hypothetical protein BKA61DRAFT_718677 [Leptodontidium sp. MPI-SDFR-AT-0119]
MVLMELAQGENGRAFMDSILPLLATLQQPRFRHSFVEWLYTSKIEATTKRLPFNEMWQLAEKLEAPRFMNALLGMLSSECALTADATTSPELDFVVPNNIKTSCYNAWKKQTSLRIETQVWTSRLERLEDPSVQSFYSSVDNDGVDKVVLTSRLLLVASGEITGLPWAPANIHRYMTKDTAFTVYPAVVEDGAASAKRKSAEELTGDKERSKRAAAS